MMAMSKPVKPLCEFGPFSIDATERVLLRDGQVVPLTPKAFELLLVLVENRGHLVEKETLMRRLWPDTFVEEANLTNNVSQLRKALLADDAPPYIETVPRRGYRFIAEVSESVSAPTEFVLEERSQTTLTLEEVSHPPPSTAVGQEPAAKKGFRWLTLTAVAALIGLGLAAYLFWSKRPPSPPVRSLAVLPFKPLIADSRDEALELGMAEMLITKLSGMRAVTVRPLGLVRKYAVLEQDPVAAGRELGVESVLDGTIQKSGDRIRATVRLVSVRDGGQLWADKFDEKLTDLFAVQDSISERLATALAVRLTGEEKSLLAKHYTDNSQAYQFYLKGHYYSWQFTDDGAKKAIEYFTQAIALDPKYAQAYAGLAESYAIRSGETLSPTEAMPKAKEAALKALALDDALAEAHYALALIYWWTWDFPGAEREFKRTLQLNPNEVEVHFSYGQYLAEQGRGDEALQSANHALQFNSLSASAYVNAAYIAYLAHRYDLAIEQSREALELDRNFNRGHLVLGKAYLEKGSYDQAISELEKALELPSGKLGMLGYAYAVTGRKGDARRVLDRLAGLSRERYISPFEVARIHVGLKDRDAAFEWLERAYSEGSDYLTLLRADPTFASLHTDPRFEALTRRLGLP